MELYRLSPLGYKLSHNVRHEDKPEWGIIHYLAKYHVRSKEQILNEVPGSTSVMLTKLRSKRILVEAKKLKEEKKQPD